MSVRLRLSLMLFALILILGGVVYTSVTALQATAQDSTELNAAGLLRTDVTRIELLADSVVETDTRADEIRLAIAGTLSSIGQLSGSLRQFFAASDFVSRDDFNRFNARLAEDYPAVRSANYAPRVSAAGRSAFEAAVREEDFANFTIKERDASGQLVTAAERAVYFPVNYIVPFAANADAFGFDMASDPARLAALELARDTGATVATEPVQLVTGDGATSVVVVTPVYRNGADVSSPEARRLAIQGFIVLTVDITRFLEKSIASLERTARVLRVEDVTGEIPLPLFTSSDSRDTSTATMDLTLPVFGRTWRVTVTTVINRAQALADLPQAAVSLRNRVGALLDGDPAQGLYGLRRHDNPLVLPTYTELVNATNVLVADVNTFITVEGAAARADLVPSVTLHAQEVLQIAETLITMLLGEQQQTAKTTSQTALVVSSIAGAIALFGAVTIYQVARSLGMVNQTASRLAAGDLSARAAVAGRDEIGRVGQALNSMAAELQSTVDTLEERIAVRTRDLQTVADVNTQISTILEPSRLLQDVADLTKERFRLYHSHVYLLNDDGTQLVLTAGAGHVGRQMVSEGRVIDTDNPNSIVANAARARKGVIINDVSQSETFLPHPLLPDTRSELAVPLIARGQLLGVLDVQSDQAGFFNADMLSVIELLAGQVATALSNAQLYDVAERTSRHERALGAIDRRIQNAVDVDDMLQVAVRELGKALRVPYTAIELQLTDDN